MVDIEKAAGAILYRQSLPSREFLIIQSSRERCQIAPDIFVEEFWEFPKGRVEFGETGEESAKREVAEETGILELEFVRDFLYKVTYATYRDGKSVAKEVDMYLAEASFPRVELSDEHKNFEWLAYDEALQRVTLSEMKKALKRAFEYIEGM